jgi:putative endonuclease
MKKGGYIYIMTNANNTTLYVGCTSDLNVRIHQHKTKVFPKSFTAKYNCIKLVYYETFHTIEEAIAREKQINGGSRKRKEVLVNTLNPGWEDLYNSI